MAKFKFEFDGLEDYLKQLDDMDKSATGMIKRAVYDGAAVIADAIKGQISALPTNDGDFVPADLPIVGITERQKAGLIEGFGIAKMTNEGGFIGTKVGFDGYNSERTQRYPNGQPNAMIANAINSGTSRRPKTSFVTKAVKSAQGRAVSAMEARFDEDMKNLTGE